MLQPQAALTFNVVLGVVKLVVAVVSSAVIDSTGRRALLLYTSYVVGLGMLILSVGFAAGNQSAGVSAST